MGIVKQSDFVAHVAEVVKADILNTQFAGSGGNVEAVGCSGIEVCAESNERIARCRQAVNGKALIVVCAVVQLQTPVV